MAAMIGHALLATLLVVPGLGGAAKDAASPPDGYYMFDVAPFKTPPKVRKPPYVQTTEPCPGLDSSKDDMQLNENLCGDLQTGQIPANPIQPSLFDGQAYPFELIQNASLEFFGSTLPILKVDPTLPKVARFQKKGKIKQQQASGSLFAKLARGRRSAEKSSLASRPAAGSNPARRSPEGSSPSRRSSEGPSVPRRAAEGHGPGQQKVKGHAQHAEDGVDPDPPRNGRGFCDTNWGVFCALFKGWSGSTYSDIGASRRSDSDTTPAPSTGGQSNDGPLTPCPSSVDYVTPVFARNYEGVWRYVVQIPHAGYFTQTIEVTSCRSSRCHLLEGACLSSPRWLSLLVAEMFYPHQSFPLPPVSQRSPVAAAPPPTERSTAHQTGGETQLSERVGELEARGEKAEEYCDGVDHIGCFQVRLYYDWFLVPGSCKCWKHDVFAQYRSGSRTPKSTNQ